MRLLVVCPVVPVPATDGGRLLMAGPLRHLAAAGHSITLVCGGNPRAAPLPDLSPVDVVLPAPHAPHGRLRLLARSWHSGQPDAELRAVTPGLLRTVEELLRTGRFDILHLEHQALAPLGSLGLARGVPVVLRQHNVEHQLYMALAAASSGPFGAVRRLHYRTQARLLRQRAARLSSDVDLCLALSLSDAEALWALDPDLRVEVLPAGVDMERFTPAAPEEEEPGLVVMTGHMGYALNADAAFWFCTEIWPCVKQAIPWARVAIVGKGPTAAVRRLAAVAGVTITGEVPAVEPWLRRAQVVVAPLRHGAGVRLKIVEAMAAGKAIVCTPAAAAGLADEACSTLMLADGAALFAEAVITLLRHDERRATLARSARTVAAQQFAWPRVVEAQSDLYQRLRAGTLR